MWNAVTKNILTSIGGCAVLAGYLVEIIVDPAIGKALQVGGTALIGLSARDSNVTSEQALASSSPESKP